jgi:hypothetical protein
MFNFDLFNVQLYFFLWFILYDIYNKQKTNMINEVWFGTAALLHHISDFSFLITEYLIKY